MGLFDFFKKKPAKKKGLDAKYRFTTTNSFRLFTEGLRALQMWEGRPQRIQYWEDRNRHKESFLTESIAKFKEAHDLYPDDMLPAFYLAVVLWADGRPDESKALFRQIALKDPDGDVGKSAQFNIVSIEHGDTREEAMKLGLPVPPQ